MADAQTASELQYRENDATSATVFAMENATPPTTPSNIRIEGWNDGIPYIAWDESSGDGNSYIYGYQYEFSLTSDFSDIFYGGIADFCEWTGPMFAGTYYFRVRAVDGSGNYSSWTTLDSSLTFQTPQYNHENETISYDYDNLIFEEGIVNNITTDHTNVYVYCKALNTIINEGSIFTVRDQALLQNTTINNGGHVILNPYNNEGMNYCLAKIFLRDTTIENGGIMTVYTGNIKNTIVNTGGCLETITEGRTDYENYEGPINFWTQASVEKTILNGGKLIVQGSHVATGTQVNSNGVVQVDGGTVNDTVINSEGIVFLETAAYGMKRYDSYSEMVVFDNVYFSGTANRTQINGGTLYVNKNTSALNTTITAGQMYVDYMGKAEDTTVTANGTLFVLGGGEAVNITVNGGMVQAATGARINNITINSGTLYLYGGAVLNGKININGTMILDDPAQNYGTVNLNLAETAAAQTLMINDLSRLKGGTLSITANADQNSGSYLLAGAATGYSQSVNLSAGDASLGSLKLGGEALTANSKSYRLVEQDNNLMLVVDNVNSPVDPVEPTDPVKPVDPNRPMLPEDPVAPEAPVMGGISEKYKKYNVTIKWDKAATADKKIKIASYEIRFDNNAPIQSKKTSYTVKNLDFGTHYYAVRAVDTNGNMSAWSELKSFTVTDETAPTAKISKVTVNGYNVTVNWTSGDKKGSVQSHELRLKAQNGAEIVRTFDGATQSATFTLGEEYVGKLNLELVASDGVNSSKIAKKNVKIKDATPPSKTVNLVAPEADAKYQATLSWDPATDNSGKISKYVVEIDGVTKTTSKNFLKVSKLAVGFHSYRVHAIDKDKNAGEWSEYRSFEVKDVTAPKNVSVQAKVEGNSVELNWKQPKDNVGVAGYELRYGQNLETKLTLDSSVTSYKVQNLSTGSYQFQVLAFDAAGNYSDPKIKTATVRELASVVGMESRGMLAAV